MRVRRTLICLAKWSRKSPSRASDSRNKPELPIAIPLWTISTPSPATTRYGLMPPLPPPARAYAYTRACVRAQTTCMCYISITLVLMVVPRYIILSWSLHADTAFTATTISLYTTGYRQRNIWLENILHKQLGLGEFANGNGIRLFIRPRESSTNCFFFFLNK